MQEARNIINRVISVVVVLGLFLIASGSNNLSMAGGCLIGIGFFLQLLSSLIFKKN